MGASKEYFIRLREEEFEKLPLEERCYLNKLGMEVRQKETNEDEKDEHYKKLRKRRIDSWNEEQEYLFKKRNNIKN